MIRCQARTLLDEQVCIRCMLRWATNDPDRPPCAPQHKVVRLSARKPRKARPS